jgi:rubrerythrin
MKNTDMEAIIEKAIANEQEANQFYLKLSERVKAQRKGGVFIREYSFRSNCGWMI